MRGALQALEADFTNGILARPDDDLESVYRRAETISAKHAASTHARFVELCGLSVVPTPPNTPTRPAKKSNR